MKKNAMLKIAAILMVAVLLTTCAISSTFAKYTSAASDEAEARVAKWGVTANMNIDSLFAKTYSIGDKVVATSEGDNILAPGTSDYVLLDTQISGTPEVSLKITYKADLTLDGWLVSYKADDGTEVTDEIYCPLVFTVGEQKFSTATVTVEDGEADVIAALERAVEEAIESYAVASVEPNKDLNEQADIFIAWAWGFDGSDVNDVKDTALGDVAADDVTAAASVKLEVGVVIEQTGSAATETVWTAPAAGDGN